MTDFVFSFSISGAPAASNFISVAATTDKGVRYDDQFFSVAAGNASFEYTIESYPGMELDGSEQIWFDLSCTDSSYSIIGKYLIGPYVVSEVGSEVS